MAPIAKCWGDRLLEDWGGYRRMYAQSQGILHRLSVDLLELADQMTRRASGGHADPVVANLITEEKIGITFMASLDLRIIEYPIVWLRMIVPRYVGIPDANSEARWRFAIWHEIEKELGLNERERKACMKQIRQQIEWDARSILSNAKMRDAA